MNLKPLFLVSAGLVGSLVFAADTWYWSPNSTGASYDSKGNAYYRWTNVNNWTNSVGTRGSGYPKSGDTAVLGGFAATSGAYAPDGSTYQLYELRIGPKGNTAINQGAYGLQAGGKGLQYLAASDQKGNWSAMYFSGTGEVPINISNNVTFAMQNGMRVTSGSNPVVVKQGQGRFLCFNEGSSDYKLPLVLIRQGSWDMSTKGTLGNTTVAFDGNDVSQRLQFGYSGSWGTGLTLNNSAIVETNGVANTGHGIFDNNRGRQLAFTGTPKVNPMVFSGMFYGGAGLRWSPNAASYVFVCSNAVSATTGKLSVEKGTVKLVTGASFTALSELAVSAGAVFEVEAGSGAGFHATGLTLGDATAQLNLLSAVETSERAYYPHKHWLKRQSGHSPVG